MTIRAKFRCHSIQKAEDGSYCSVRLSAVTTGSVENEEWSKYTPDGHLSLHITNPAAFDQLKQNEEYYLDITSVD
ncbi:hypothetical protein [Pantoea ananatis]|uniref:hypothetical protein n=1 Tax=Pantoea ananas TaxID=553 RepID=UPI001B30454A|nr:hypothetical protein [Pantoea ananatis]URL13310.1 hypothetical protein LVR30_13780 [Pantoea ananatis]